MQEMQTTKEDALEDVSPDLSPKMIIELVEDPTAAQAWFRVNAVKVAKHLMQTIMHPSVPTSQKIQFMQACAKNGNLMPERKDEALGSAATRPMVNIVFSGQPERSLSVQASQVLERAE